MKKQRITLAALAVVLVLTIVIGASLAYLTDQGSVKNTFSVGDLNITIDEENWDDGDDDTPGDGDDLTPGDSKVKDPLIKSIEGDAYMRVVMTIKDKVTGDVITDTTRLGLILQTLYYDTDFNPEDLTAGNLVEGTKYSLQNIADLKAAGKIYNPVNTVDFTINNTKSTAGKYYYNYNTIFEEEDQVYFMTNVIIPTDWNQTQLAKLGKYTVEFKAEAIQSKNFANATAAFTALDAEIAAGTAQTVTP